MTVFCGEDLEAQYGAMAALRPRVDAMIFVYDGAEMEERARHLREKEAILTIRADTDAEDPMLIHAASLVAS
ncbi:MAG: hypothetical protein QHH01_01940, partial [Spirochaetales bacterium]|nr:hypothetical protein [Spirochaetales bacterium]